MRRLITRSAAALLCLCALSPYVCPPAGAQSGQQVVIDPARGLEMLKAIRNDLKRHYYDPNFRGVDVEARFAEAERKIKASTSTGEIFGHIAQALISLGDSHTYFVPPELVTRVEYGWRMQMVGDAAYVVSVLPGSDAERKGLKVGDRVVAIDGFGPTRDTFWKIIYSYHTLMPALSVRLDVQSPRGQARRLDLQSSVLKSSPVVREKDFKTVPLFFDAGDVLVCRLPDFDLEERGVDEMMKRAAGRRALILDLRGNGGGYETALLRLLGHLFERDVKVGDERGRKESKPLVAKTVGARAFRGELVVLVDSRSASASELLARLVQLEKRGRVVGDRTPGAVMRGRLFAYAMRSHAAVLDASVAILAPTVYAASVTDADLVMTDGKSLEGVGVTPDELMLPSGEDLAAKRDPVLARAAELVGLKLTPEKAGELLAERKR